MRAFEFVRNDEGVKRSRLRAKETNGIGAGLKEFRGMGIYGSTTLLKMMPEDHLGMSKRKQKDYEASLHGS